MEDLNLEKNEKKNKKIALKTISYVIAFGLGFTIGTSSSTNNIDVDSNELKEIQTNTENNTNKNLVEEKEEQIEQKKKQEPCPVKIQSITASENSIGASEANVSFINNGKDAIKNLEFYICAWDTNGYPVKLKFGNRNYLKCQSDQPNTLPGKSDKYTWTTYSSGNSKVGKYEAVISKVEYYDGTEWINELAEQEIEKISSETNK